ncbi:MAG: cupin domain-containing protein [Synergistaceae bacterium]|nr:cupin domain-containing protein [Synergistaceae bacterium]
MILKNQDDGIQREKLGGSGKGKALAFPVTIPDQNGAFVMATRIELEPGASVGYHLHADTEEVYFVMAGEGSYCEENESRQVHAGDVMLCRMGRSHGIENNSGKTLVLGAAIAKRS